MGRWLRVLTSLIVLLVGCGGGSKDGPDECDNPPLLAAQWTGSITDDVRGLGTIVGAFVQDGCVFGGATQVCFAGACETGTLDAVLDGTVVTGDLQFAGDCRDEISATFTRTLPSVIAGTYVRRNCATAGGGTFTLTLIVP